MIMKRDSSKLRIRIGIQIHYKTFLKKTILLKKQSGSYKEELVNYRKAAKIIWLKSKNPLLINSSNWFKAKRTK